MGSAVTKSENTHRGLTLSIGDLAHACGLLGFAFLLAIALAYDGPSAQTVMPRDQMNDFGKFYYSAR